MGLKPAPAVRLTKPVSYLESLSLEADARIVFTDSGDVQEETTYLGCRASRCARTSSAR